MKMKQSLEEFIIEYLFHSDSGVSVLDSDFHDKVHEEFPHFKQKIYIFGACPVQAAMRCLQRLYKDHRLERGSVSLGMNWQPGFPKWVYVYTIYKG